jgi:hypothetical protein
MKVASLALFFSIATILFSIVGCATNSRDEFGQCPKVAFTVGCPFGEERKCATNSDGCTTCGCEPRPGGFTRPDPSTPPRP